MAFPEKTASDARITDVREIVELKGSVSERTLEALEKLLAFPYTESVTTEESAEEKKLVVMNHVGRADRRACEIASAVHSLEHNAKIEVRIGKEYVFSDDTREEEIAELAGKIVNPLIESVGFDAADMDKISGARTEVIENFNSAQYTEFTEMKEKYRIKMDIDDLMCVQNYFLSESREPTLTELRIIDAYFSESFRHTTFETYLDNVEIDDSIVKASWENYCEQREGVSHSLSDIACAPARLAADDSVVKVSKKLSGVKLYGDKENSGPVLVVKNESHNRSTTLSPYDGAGGSISSSVSDLLCVFGKPFETYRVSGTGYSEKNKYNSRLATKGYAAYAAALGVPCSKCTELKSNGYSDKQLEICAALAVADSASAEKLNSREPDEGDMIFLLGGKTGADGALKSKIAEDGTYGNYGEYIPVGQPGVMGSLIRLFSRKEFKDIAVAVNDVSSGGIICAIGEMTDSAVIKADAVHVKQELISAEEIILSESLERMLVCVKKDDAEALVKLCREENVECTSIATLSDNGRITVYDENNQRIASLSSEFLISGGAEKHLSAKVERSEELPESEALTAAQAPLKGVNSLKILFQGIRPDFMGAFAKAKELAQGSLSLTSDYYDKTAGGDYVALDRESEASLRALRYNGKPVTDKDEKEKCSVIACGVNPAVSHASPFKGAYLSVTEALMKLAASGYGKERAYLSIQEYLPEHKNSSKRLGVSVAAMLGVYEAQMNLGACSLGGKISLGTSASDTEYDSTITTFAFCIGEKGREIPCSFVGEGGKIVLLQPEYDKGSGLPRAESQKELIDALNELIEDGEVLSAASVNAKCAATVMIEMCRRNGRGALIEPDADTETLFENCYGAVLLETKADAQLPKSAEVIGTVIGRHHISYKDEMLELSESSTADDGEAKEIDYALYEGKCEYYGEVKIAENVLSVLLVQSEFSVAAEETKRRFESLGAAVTVFPVGALNQDAFAKAVTRTDILWIPDGADVYTFMSAALVNPTVQSAVAFLRRKRGLIYGCGSGFAALVASGVMGLDTERLGFCKVSDIPINRKVSLKCVSSLSPFVKNCELGSSYESYVSGSALGLKAEMGYINELAQKGQIALCFRENVLDCECGVEAVTSEDGTVFGQLSQPARLAADESARGVIDVVCAAVGYFKAEKEAEKAKE